MPNARRPILLLAFLGIAASAGAADRNIAVNDLRLFNPTRNVVSATVVCATSIRTFVVTPGEVADMEGADLDQCRESGRIAHVRVIVPEDMMLIDVATRGDFDEQRLVSRALDICPLEIVMSLPLLGCRFGTATASIAPIDGALYDWKVMGGSILSGNGTPKILLALGDGANALVSVAVNNRGCLSNGGGVISLHDAFTVNMTADPARVDATATLRWSFTGGEPVAQSITGTDFPQPLNLPTDVRTYTYTPSVAGAKDVSIFATSVAAPLRRRPSGRARDSASTCTSAQTSITYQVDECAKPTLSIQAPAMVVAGSAFDVRAVTDATSVHWTITNGSPAAADGTLVTIRAGTTGTVGFSATAKRGSCPFTASSSGSSAIVAELVCSHPTATVSAGPSDCSGGTVNVTFTGVPPFRGKWSDGESFTAQGVSMTRRVTSPGSYNLISFEDAACAGTTSGVANFAAFGPQAQITSTGSCTKDTVTVTFTGRPPFVGQWSDNESFTTSEMRITRQASTPGPLTILYFDDAQCRGTVNGSLYIFPNPTISARTDWPVDPATDCYPYPAGPGLQDTAGLAVDFDGGTLPLSVTWSDGVTSTANSWPVRRYVLARETTTYTVVSAHDAHCPATLLHPSVTLWISPRPDVIVDNLGPAGSICDHVATTAHLATAPPAGTTVTWTIQNGTITGGQGTPTVSFTTGTNGPGAVTSNFTFNDRRCPIATTKNINVTGVPGQPTIQISPSTIQPGGTATITYTLGANTYVAGLDMSRRDEITPLGDCVNSVCHATFHDLLGVGTSTITVNVKGYCLQPNNASATITITP
jgi:hypothetical protein